MRGQEFLLRSIRHADRSQLAARNFPALAGREKNRTRCCENRGRASPSPLRDRGGEAANARAARRRARELVRARRAARRVVESPGIVASQVAESGPLYRKRPAGVGCTRARRRLPRCRKKGWRRPVRAGGYIPGGLEIRVIRFTNGVRR